MTQKGCIWVVIQFKVLPRHLPAKNEENHENLRLGDIWVEI
jgi:hypothetical protein